MGKSASPPPSSPWLESRAAYIVALSLTVGLLYTQTLWYDFVAYDDPTYVLQNPRVRTGLTWENVRWAWSTFYFSNYHPLTWNSFQLDAQLGGGTPGLFHATNVILHWANTVLLFLLLDRCVPPRWGAFLVALIFAVHPLHVESVAWISSRKDVLSMFFGLLAMFAYLAYTARPSWQRYLLIVLCLFASLLSKQVLVTLPCVLLLFDVWPLKRIDPADLSTRGWRAIGVGRCIFEKIPLLAMCLLFMTLIYLAQSSGGAMKAAGGIPFPWRLANAIHSYAAYLGQAFVPWNLIVHYRHPRESLPLWEVGAAAGLLGAITWRAWRQRSHTPAIMIGWLWFLGTLVPMIGLIQVGEQARADRYMYVPLVGLAIMLVYGIAACVPKFPRLRSLLTTGGAVGLGVWGILGFLQVQVWRDSESLLRHAISVDPACDRAHLVLASYLLQVGRTEEAAIHNAKSLQLLPDGAKAIYNLGLIALRDGDHATAELLFRRAIELEPDYALARRGLATVLLQAGFFDAAREQLKYLENIVNVAEHSEVAYLWGAYYEATSKPQQAATAYQRALGFDPHHPDAKASLERLRQHP